MIKYLFYHQKLWSVIHNRIEHKKTKGIFNILKIPFVFVSVVSTFFRKFGLQRLE